MMFMRNIALMLFLAAWMALAGTLAAQDEQTISIGQSVQGELSTQVRRAAYVFEGSAGTTIIAMLDSRHFDAYLLLVDAAGTVLAEDNDSGEGFNAQIVFTLQNDGPYTLMVTSQREYRSSGTFYAAGRYVLTLEERATVPLEITPEAAPESSPTPGVPDGMMVPGDMVRGRITADLPSQTHILRADAGDVVQISLVAEDFDSYLILLDAEGHVLQEDDDSGGGLNARVGPLELPYSGDYTLMVSSFAFVTESRTETGSYRLQVDAVAVQPIAFETTVSGQLSERQPRLVYRLQPEPGDVVIATLETGDFAVSMQLQAPGVRLSTFGGSATIGPVIIQAEAGYVITVTSADLFLPSVYSLRLERITPQHITYDAMLDLSFDGTDRQYFLFEGTRGDVIDVRVESGGQFDSQLSIIDAYGVEIGFDDDSGTGFDPEINRFPLVKDGMYSLLVRPYIPGDDAEVRLILARNMPPSLDDGPQVVRISDKQPDALVVFSGHAGAQMAVRARVLAGAENEPRIVITQADTRLAANSIGDVDGLILEFMVPVSSPVLVALQDFGGSPAVIEFSLVQLENETSRG